LGWLAKEGEEEEEEEEEEQSYIPKSIIEEYHKMGHSSIPSH